MPKATYFKLNLEKQNKIEKALIGELERNSVDKISISKVIEQAQIPRGSFYQYFENKEDAINYIINKFIKKENKKIYDYLVEKKGDIFETSLRMFDDIVEDLNNEKNIKLSINILEELRRNNISIIDKERVSLKEKEKIESIIDFSMLNIERKSDIKYFMGIVTLITRVSIMEVIQGKISIEEGRKILVKEFDILKKGMVKF